MAVNTTQGGPWRALLKRGLDTAADLSDLVAKRDRRRHGSAARLRRRRRALRWA